MAPQNNSKKFEKLVVHAIRKLQDIQGSTFKEISDFLSREYDVPTNQIKKQVRLALRRGVSYGILQRHNGNTYTCNKKFLERQSRLKKIGEVVERYPWIKPRVWHKNKRGSINRRRVQKGRVYKSQLHKAKKRSKRKKGSKKMNMGRRRPMNRLRKLKGKNLDWLELLGLLLTKNKDPKYSTKKRRHRQTTRSRGRKKKGGQ
ncbi:hypothetical protein PV325_008181 [Microctonus aethiopoides]|uniref:H15 domain-containing protein n=1 Tax=Microctonus aethiopoides TaxID=144406 RepID=A0AA39KXH9_9HYME|nr:hypothetical protein PV325_008181 [Microctonus aethiopoides]KAK0092251.1 hypothetical protein PV326_001851 [Microctonus aethiopoides]KAK0177312.1 hypothetical protein PV328_001380 [Microctonus aethiopoides]